MTGELTEKVNGVVIRQGAVLREANLDGANLEGRNLRGVDLTRASLRDACLDGATLDEANLSHANLVGASFIGARMRNSKLHDVVATGANFYEAYITESDLTYGHFNKAILSRAIINSCDGYAASFRDALMKGTSLCYFKGKRVDFSVANLTNAIMMYADCEEAGFTSAKLINTDFRSAKLKKASFRNAFVQGINLGAAEIALANFSGAEGLLDPYKWIEENFEKVRGGFIVYKRLGYGTQYPRPINWTVRKGSVLVENCHPDRTQDCACGVNFGTLAWCGVNYVNSPLWRCKLDQKGLATLVVPYNTVGKARTGYLKLLEMVNEQEMANE